MGGSRKRIVYQATQKEKKLLLRKKAISASQAIINTNNVLLKAKCYLQKGIIYNYSYTNKGKAALENYLLAKEIYTQNSVQNKLIITNILIGEAHINLGEQNKADFEVSIANEVKLAAEVRDCVLNGLDAQEAKAAETRDAALAKAEADKEAGMAEFAAARAAVEAEIEEEKRHDAIAHDHITDEIKEVAEKLLAINAQITEHLTALTNL